MDHLAAATASGRFSSREEAAAEAEGEQEEDASNNSSRREISFMPAAASSSSSSAAVASASTSASASSSAAPFRSGGGAPAEEAVEKEHMFDKVVTPSDVGKLNRLVIPKQYAEKYFPLGTAAGSDKGLLLTFEDTSGNKHWRFRYSYWNSSQSYVMTKGWSRFVKEKRLLAGDTVSFSRAAAASDDARGSRLFIDWKRRVDARGPLLRFPTLMPLAASHHHYAAPWAAFGAGAGGGGGFFMPPSPPATLYEHHRLRQGLDFRAMTMMPPTVGRQQLLLFGSARTATQPALPLHYAVQPSAAAAPTRPPLVLESVPVIESPTTAAKRVRLFGVNLDNNPQQPDSDGGGEPSHQQGNNALSLQMPGYGWRQRTTPTLRLLEELPRHGGAESSAASSPSSSSSSKREARSSAALDLDL